MLVSLIRLAAHILAVVVLVMMYGSAVTAAEKQTEISDNPQPGVAQCYEHSGAVTKVPVNYACAQVGNEKIQTLRQAGCNVPGFEYTIRESKAAVVVTPRSLMPGAASCTLPTPPTCVSGRPAIASLSTEPCKVIFCREAEVVNSMGLKKSKSACSEAKPGSDARLDATANLAKTLTPEEVYVALPELMSGLQKSDQDALLNALTDPLDRKVQVLAGEREDIGKQIQTLASCTSVRCTEDKSMLKYNDSQLEGQQQALSGQIEALANNVQRLRDTSQPGAPGTEYSDSWGYARYLGGGTFAVPPSVDSIENAGSLSAYEPTWRDRTASFLSWLGLPDQTVEGLVGSRGLGKTRDLDIADWPVVNIPFGVDEAFRDPDPLTGALRLASVAVPEPAKVPLRAVSGVVARAVDELPTLYHGSSLQFDKFSLQNRPRFTPDDFGPGHYLTSVRPLADRFALDRAKATGADSGITYVVNVDAKKSQFINWDLPLTSRWQSPTVMNILSGTFGDNVPKMPSLLLAPQNRTSFLQLIGSDIVGIRHADRTIGWPWQLVQTYGRPNYTVWDDSLLEIIEKKTVPVR